MAAFQIGDRVRLLRLEAWFFNGIPADEVEFLRACIGLQTEIVGFDQYGHAEIGFAVPGLDEGRYQGHTLWVDQSWIEKV